MVGPVAGWATVAAWRLARSEGETLAETEARACASYPTEAAAIRAHYSRVADRRRQAEETMRLYEEGEGERN